MYEVGEVRYYLEIVLTMLSNKADTETGLNTAFASSSEQRSTSILYTALRILSISTAVRWAGGPFLTLHIRLDSSFLEK